MTTNIRIFAQAIRKVVFDSLSLSLFRPSGIGKPTIWTWAWQTVCYLLLSRHKIYIMSRMGIKLRLKSQVKPNRCAPIDLHCRFCPTKQIVFSFVSVFVACNFTIAASICYFWAKKQITLLIESYHHTKCGWISRNYAIKQINEKQWKVAVVHHVKSLRSNWNWKRLWVSSGRELSWWMWNEMKGKNLFEIK